MKNMTASERSGKRRLSKFARAFIILFAVFLTAGFFTLGSFRSTGKTFGYVAGDDSLAAFNLNMTEEQSKLTAVYINVGSIYLEPGEYASVTVRRSTSANTKPNYTVGSAKLGNIYSEKNDSNIKEGANFNWVTVAAEKNLTAKCITVSATANIDINEIVCIGDDGKTIPLSVNVEFSQGNYSKSELANAIDAQNSFSASDSAWKNFTQEEGYYMTSIHTVLGGGEITSESVYNVDRDFNSLATVLLLPSVAIFGDSTFALRLTPFLATSATLLLVYLFASLLFKDEKYGFIFSLIFAFGGLATTVGRLGAPYALITCFLVASLYFMYRFFAKGISSERIIKDGLNILFSGLFAALALAMNFLTIIPVAGILILFAFGMRRQKLAYINELNKSASRIRTEAAINAEAESGEAGEKSLSKAVSAAEKESAALSEMSGDAAAPASEEANSLAKASAEKANSVAEKAAFTPETAEGTKKKTFRELKRGASSIAIIGKEANVLKAAYSYKSRVSWAFAALSFVLAAFVFMLLASVITYNAFVKAFDNPADPSLSYATLFFKGFTAPFHPSNVTEYTAANASNVFAWLMPLKAATVYDPIAQLKSSRYLAWNVSMNAAVAVVALVSFAFCSVSVISDAFSSARSSRMNKRIRRIYLILLGGAVTSMLAAAFVRNVSVIQSSLFGVFYIGFIPLAVKICQPAEIKLTASGRAKVSFADILSGIFISVFIVFFALSVPGMYGFGISAKAAERMFCWMSIFSNGYFRI